APFEGKPPGHRAADESFLMGPNRGFRETRRLRAALGPRRLRRKRSGGRPEEKSEKSPRSADATSPPSRQVRQPTAKENPAVRQDDEANCSSNSRICRSIRFRSRSRIGPRKRPVWEAFT